MPGLSLGLGLGLTPSKGGGYVFADASAASYVARMALPPSNEQKAIYDAFFTQLKAIGAGALYASLIDMGFLCTHTFQAALLGLKNVINPTPIGSNHYHVPNEGWAGDGATSLLSLGYAIPAGSQNLAGMGLFTSDQNAYTPPDMGNDTCALLARFTDDRAYYRMNSSTNPTPSVGRATAAGLHVAKRTTSNAATEKYWFNGSRGASTGFTSVTPDTRPIYLGGRNLTAGVQYCARSYQFWFIGPVADAYIPAFAELVRNTVTLLRASSTVLSVTKETKSLKRTLVDFCSRQEWLFGGFDNFNWFNSTIAPETELRYHVDDMATVTGKKFVIRNFEYQDRRVVGNATANTLRDRIIAHHAEGGIVWISDHCGNPVTGSFGQEPSSPSPPTTGNQYDLNGSPILNCFPGGTARASFEDYVANIAVFLRTLVDASGKLIPVVWRPFHEINNTAFWWASPTPANTAELFRQFVTQMRVNGISNALLDWNSVLVGTTGFRGAYPGADFCDVLSSNWYDDATNLANVLGLVEAGTPMTLVEYPPLGMMKPHYLSEFGYQYGSHGVADIWSTKTGNVMKASYWGWAGGTLWRSPWGVTPTMSNTADFVTMVSDPACITLDKLTPGAYGRQDYL